MKPMTTTPTKFQATIPAAATVPPVDSVLQIEARLSLLRHYFEIDFTLLDVSSGDVIRQAADTAKCDWDSRWELCRQVARRGRPEFIDDDDLLLMLAVPLPEGDASARVAVGAFISRPVQQESDVAGAARLLNLPPREALRWATREVPRRASALLRLAEITVEKLTADARVTALEEEVDSISAHLAATYEEISLLHRLAQNLKISRSDRELGLLALEWLSVVVPAEGFALKLKLNTSSESPEDEQPLGGDLLTYGECPLTGDQIDAVIEGLGPEVETRPIVLNPPAIDDQPFSTPRVRQLIAAPLVEGDDHTFGWLLVLNHADDEEFGTVEASLVASVAAILGIHCGNTDLYQQRADLLSGVVRALTSAIDAKDPYTCGHSDRVARISVRLAKQLGCDAETLNTIYLSGLLHDIGKIGIDDSVLRKPGKLTAAEFEHIKLHPELGHKILRDLKQLGQVLPVVRHHHEAYDGSGYPDRLAGEAIPFFARIVGVADAFDAMSSDRPYRPGMPDEKLDAILRDGAGQQWDAQVIEAFFSIRDQIRQLSEQERAELNLQAPQFS
jgi:hypothetical protein